MTYSSRDKLNGIYLTGSVVIAAVCAAIASDASLFVIIAASLIIGAFMTGKIRFGSRRR